MVLRRYCPRGEFCAILVCVFGDAGPVLRSHKVNNLQDRVNLIRRLIWHGEAAFNRRLPPRGGLLDPQMRQLGLLVTAGCRARNDMCELESIYRFVTARAPDSHPNVRYTGDITDKDTFQSALRTLQYRGGDCLPLTTKVLKLGLRAEGCVVPLAAVEVGDLIMADGDWTRVERVWLTGRKQILVFELNNNTALRCSPEHRLLLMDGTEKRAGRVEVGEQLLTPRYEISFGFGNVIPVSGDGARVVAIHTAKHVELCMDITTEAGRFWLPESDVLVHNCDDHTALCAVLAMENGFRTRARITSNEGVSWDHIYCLAGLPKGNPTRWVALDTTLPGYRFNTHPPQAKHQDFDLDEPK